jgi:PPOX class probable FMN-dependent enzyme
VDANAIFGDRFHHVVSTESELRDIVGPANRWLTSKMLAKLDPKCRRFIAISPFVVIGSAGTCGPVELSPKGDPPGFVHVLDDSTLVVPDRPGNRRVDTFRNVLQNPHVGLVFLVPGRRETLRVFGIGLIVRDDDIRNAVAMHGRAPDLALVVGVQRAFFHCGRCITRSQLWDAPGDMACAAEA